MAQDTRAYLIATIDGPITNIRTKNISSNAIAVTFNGKASPDGTLFNPEKAEKPRSSAREYDRLPVRIWDHYITAEKNAIWYTRLEKHEGRYCISPAGFINALRGTGLEYPNPDPLHGGVFDLSAKGILFTSVDPGTNQAILIKDELYYIPIQTYTEKLAPTPYKISVKNYNGEASCPTFSPGGRSAAFLHTKVSGSEYDQPRIFFVRDIDNVDDITEITTSDSWELQPQSLTFSGDAKTLYLTAEDQGRTKVFSVPVPPAFNEEEQPTCSTAPTPITSWGSVSSVHGISPNLLLLTLSSITESSIFATLDSSTGTLQQLSRQTNYGTSHFAQHPSQVSEIKIPRDDGTSSYSLQAFVVTPSSFSAEKKYPLLLWIHGGPASSFLDEWSTRWNPAFFAEQGYAVVLPNITGSTGFGPDFISAVDGEWGGRPLRDLVACFNHVESTMNYVDTTRAVAMGGSYGGYMVNWIAGQPFSGRFRALASHDGIFNLSSMLASDEIASLPPSLGGFPWDDPTAWEKWDPSRHTAGWATPMLVVHSEKDYRCPITEGLAVFGVCQAKGVASKFLSFPDEGHWVLGRENSLRWHRTVLGWCDGYCGVERG